MDATVDDFLKEINELVPPKPKPVENAWKECYDENTGYCYYWNVNTDEVTWDMPPDFKQTQEQPKPQKKTNSLYIPPKTITPVPPVAVPISTESIKIYKIQNEKPKVLDTQSENVTTEKTYAKSKKRRTSSDSEDEKIVLISSYGGDTESEEEEEQTKAAEVSKENSEVKIKGPSLNLKIRDESDSEEEILTKLQHKAKVLKELGGELPPEIKQLVENDSKPEKTNDISGFTLVAGYGSDDDDDSDVEDIEKPSNGTSLFPVVLEENKVTHSPLFPVVEPIDVRQFANVDAEKQKKPDEHENAIDVKAFQRKRKIDIDLVNAQKRPKTPEKSEKRGFGFNTAAVYPGFQSGGVLFAKSEAANAVETETSAKTSEKSKDLLSSDLEEIRVTLSEKLAFLSEGHKPVPPVQVMLIQIETLHSALIEGSLNANYFKKWLNDTCTDLIKLELEAAPNGWLLQWDRSNKRYYYRNKVTDESQWEYPQPDVIRCDEAMDISTTPPPPPDDDDDVPANKNACIVPPPPPNIRSSSPVPPPPPVITAKKKKSSARKKNVDPPLPPPEVNPPLPPDSFTYGEPLPPGVDMAEVIPFPNEKEGKKSNDDALSSVLDSFYSDLAAISSGSQPVAPAEVVEEKTTDVKTVVEPPKKKKKTKVKLAQGLAMKKKGVSKLVEKWKNVQKSLD